MPSPSPLSTPDAQRTARPRVRYRYELSSSAILYVGITLLIALGAFNSQNNLLFWTFGLALAVLIVSGLVSGAMLMGVDVVRESISDAHVGEPLRLRYRVRNRNRVVPLFALTIWEDGYRPRKPPGRTARLLGMFFKSAPHAPPIAPPHAFVAHLQPGATAHVDAFADTLRRGPLRFTVITAHSSFPFGLMRKTLRFAQPGATVVLPAVIKPPQEVLSSSSATGLSGTVSRRPGTGDEFFSLREYAPGDAFRDIAWSATARRGSLLVRQNALPSPLRLWIVLRLRPTPGSEADDERAISLAAGIARDADLRSMDLGLSIPLTRSLVHPRHGPGHAARLLTELGLLDLGPDDGRGRFSAFPPHCSGPTTMCVVIHSGPIDRSWTPSGGSLHGIVHISAADPAPRPRPAEAAKAAAA